MFVANGEFVFALFGLFSFFGKVCAGSFECAFSFAKGFGVCRGVGFYARVFVYVEDFSKKRHSLLIFFKDYAFHFFLRGVDCVSIKIIFGFGELVFRVAEQFEDFAF